MFKKGFIIGTGIMAAMIALTGAICIAFEKCDKLRNIIVQWTNRMMNLWIHDFDFEEENNED